MEKENKRNRKNKKQSIRKLWSVYAPRTTDKIKLEIINLIVDVLSIMKVEEIKPHWRKSTILWNYKSIIKDSQ